ncbi:hypothetical protein FRX31_018321 [Thalictrum thalictroides]|uniref:Uncharacterized protein n=1 Tax=Thalictrum thalictroides TaxID=46969 RepID=A0A7J6W4U7_THATH|nr:hypothetical protein FRX31_018321 [Thalictrum thalictroides]
MGFGSGSPIQLDSSEMTYIKTNQWGEPNEKSCLALTKAITYHAGYYIPKMYKDGCGMPNDFIAKMVEAVKKSFGTENLAKDYLTDRVKAIWKEWVSPPSTARPSTRRNPSINFLDYLEAEMENPNLWKTIITVDEWGKVDCNEDRKALLKAINFQVRRLIPIIYKDARNLPNAFIERVMEALEENFSFNEVPEDCYITDLVKAAWSRYKNELRKKYITDKDPATVKASSPSPFVTNKDWSIFVDMCTSREYKAMCSQNLANRRNGEVPSTHGACNFAGVGSENEMEGNQSFDAELGRTDAEDRKALVKTTNFQVRCFIPIIYKDSREVRNAFIERVMDALEENFNFIHIPDDCYITDIVKESWWRHKNIKDRDPAVVKEFSPSPFVTNEDWAQFVDMCTSSEYKALCARNLKSRKDKVVTPNNRCNSTGISPEISTIQLGSNLSSRVFAGSSIQPCLTHQLDVGKRCDLLAWGSEVIACGEVVAVDPALNGHVASLGEGVYKIAIKKVIISGSLLYKPDDLRKTIGDVGAGGLVVWPRCFLDIHH